MKNELINKYDPIIKQASFIAGMCNCSYKYVIKIFRGERNYGTERAKKATKVIQLADELLAIHNKHITNNSSN